MSAPAATTPAEYAQAVANNKELNLNDYADWTTAPLGIVVKGRLIGKVAIVTGASSGIGAVTARRLAAEGAKVVLFARREERLAKLVDVIKKAGGEAAYFVGDAGKEADNKALVEFTVKTFGGLHITFNNAGISRGRGLKPWEVESNMYDELMSTNVSSIFYAIKHQGPVIGKSGGGVILNNASTAAFNHSIPSFALYSASKSWVVWYSKHCAYDLSKIGVRINTISPGFTLSEIGGSGEEGRKRTMGLAAELSAIGRALKPEEIAGNVAYLASDEGKGITGIDVIIDGGVNITARI